MAEDNPPISTDVPETVTVDTQADKATIDSLNKDFADFWKEADAKEAAPDAPEAPGEGAAQETKESKTPAKESEEPEAPAKPLETPVKTPAPKEYSDEEIDKFALTNKDVRPEAIENFKQLRAGWKAERAKAKAEAERAAKLETELIQARQNAWTPEAKADYEHAAAIRRRFDFASDPEFIQRFHQPILNTFDQVLEEAVGVLPDRQAAIEWANYIKQNYKPDALDRNWWLNSVVAKVPNELDRSTLLSSVTQLLRMQKERDGELQRRTGDQAAFDNWIQEKTNFTAQRVQEEIMSEIGVQEKRIQEVLPRDPEAAKTSEERKAIEAHNERFTRLNKYFTDTMKDLSQHGPKAWVRASVEATRSMILEEHIKEIESELKSAKTERDQYKSELEKIQGVRRRISHTTGTPPTPSGQKPKIDGGLSIKNLDVRRAFDDYQWGDEDK
jgi:hypothetical protein